MQAKNHSIIFQLLSAMLGLTFVGSACAGAGESDFASISPPSEQLAPLFDVSRRSIADTSESGPISVDDLTGVVSAHLPQVGPFIPSYRGSQEAGFVANPTAMGSLGQFWFYGPSFLVLDQEGVTQINSDGTGTAFVRDYLHTRRINSQGEFRNFHPDVASENGVPAVYMAPDRNLISQNFDRISLELTGASAGNLCGRIYWLRRTDGSKTKYLPDANCSKPASSGLRYLPDTDIAVNGATTTYEYETSTTGRKRLVRMQVAGGIGFRFEWQAIGNVAIGEVPADVIEKVFSTSSGTGPDRLLGTFAVSYFWGDSIPQLQSVQVPDGSGVGSYTTQISYHAKGAYSRSPLQFSVLCNSSNQCISLTLPSEQTSSLLKGITLPTGGVATVQYAWERVGLEPSAIDPIYYLSYNCRRSAALCEANGGPDIGRSLSLRAKSLSQGGATFEYSFDMNSAVPQSTPSESYLGTGVGRSTVVETSQNKYRRDVFSYVEGKQPPSTGPDVEVLGKPFLRVEAYDGVGVSMNPAILPHDCTGSDRTQVAHGGRQFLSCKRWKWISAEVNTLPIRTEGGSGGAGKLTDLGGTLWFGMTAASPVVSESYSFKVAPNGISTPLGQSQWERTRFAYDFANALSTPVRTDRDLVTLDAAGNVVANSERLVSWHSQLPPLGRDTIEWANHTHTRTYQIGLVGESESCVVSASAPFDASRICADGNSHRLRLTGRQKTIYDDVLGVGNSKLPVCSLQQSVAGSPGEWLRTANRYGNFGLSGFLPTHSGPVGSCSDDLTRSPYASNILAYAYGQVAEAVSPAGVKVVNTFNDFGQVTRVESSVKNSEGAWSPRVRAETIYDAVGRPWRSLNSGIDDTGGTWKPVGGVSTVVYPTGARLAANLGKTTYTYVDNGTGTGVIDYSATCADEWGRAIAATSRVSGSVHTAAQAKALGDAEQCAVSHGFSVSRTTYNELGLAKSTTVPTGVISTPVYDVFGSTASMTSRDAAGTVVGYSEARAGVVIEGGRGVTIARSRNGNSELGSNKNQTVSWTSLDGRALRTLAWQPDDGTSLPLTAASYQSVPRVEYAYVFGSDGSTTATITPWGRASSATSGASPQSSRKIITDLLGRTLSEEQPEIDEPTDFAYDPVRGLLSGVVGARAYDYIYDNAGRLVETRDAATNRVLTGATLEPITGLALSSVNYVDDVFSNTLLDHGLRPHLVSHDLPAPADAPVPVAPTGEVNKDTSVTFSWGAPSLLPSSYQLVVYDAATGAAVHVANPLGSALSYSVNLGGQLVAGRSYTWTLVGVYSNKTIGAKSVLPFVAVSGSGGGGGTPTPSTMLVAQRPAPYPTYRHGDVAVLSLSGNTNSTTLVESVERRRVKDGVIVKDSQGNEWIANPELTMIGGRADFQVRIDVNETPAVCGRYQDEYRLAGNTSVRSAILSYQTLCDSGLEVLMSAPANGSNYATQERYRLTITAPGTVNANRAVQFNRFKQVNGQWTAVPTANSVWRQLQAIDPVRNVMTDSAGNASGDFQFDLTNTDCGQMRDDYRLVLDGGQYSNTWSNEYYLECASTHPVAASTWFFDVQSVVAGQSKSQRIILWPMGMPSTFRVLPSQLTFSRLGGHAAQITWGALKKLADGSACLEITAGSRCYVDITYTAPTQTGVIPDGTAFKVDYYSGVGSVPQVRDSATIAVRGLVAAAGSKLSVKWSHDQSTFLGGAMSALDGHAWGLDVRTTDTDPSVTRRVTIVVAAPMRWLGGPPDVNPYPTTSTTHQSFDCFLRGGATSICGPKFGPKPGTLASVVNTPVRVIEHVCSVPNATWQQCQLTSSMTKVSDQTYNINLDTWGNNHSVVKQRTWVSLLGVAGTATDPVVMPDAVLGDRAGIPMSLWSGLHYTSHHPGVVGEGDFAAVRPLLHIYSPLDGVAEVRYLQFGEQTRNVILDQVQKVGPMSGRVCLNPDSYFTSPDWYNPATNPADRQCYEVRGNGTPRAVIAPQPGGSTQFPITEAGTYRKLPFKITNLGTYQRFNGTLKAAAPFKFVVQVKNDAGGVSEQLVSTLPIENLLGQWHPGSPPNFLAFTLAFAPPAGKPGDVLEGAVSGVISADVCVVEDPSWCKRFPGEKVELVVTGTAIAGGGTSSRTSGFSPQSVVIEYDEFGRTKSSTSPVSSIVQTLTYGVSGGAAAVGMKSTPSSAEQVLSSVSQTDAIGRPLRYTYGEAAANSRAYAWRSYDSAGRLSGDALTVGTTNPLVGTACSASGLWYCASGHTYDDRGFIVGMVRNDSAIQRTGTNQNLAWGYSTQGQLTRFSVNGIAETYQYDLRGNLTARSGMPANGRLLLPGSPSMSYAANNRIFSPDWGYNSAGEVIQDKRDGQARRYEYDVLGRLKLVREVVPGQPATAPATGRILEDYIYDAAGMRVRSRNGVEDTYSFRNGGLIAAERRVNVATGTETIVDVLGVNGQAAVTRIEAGSGVSLEFQHNDRLGSPAVKWTSALNRYNFEYSPYGQLMLGDRNRIYGYTGHEEDATGLIYMRARYDDPSLGRLMTPDPARDFSAFAPHSFNLYSYTAGNPANAVDPSGMVAVPSGGTNRNRAKLCKMDISLPYCAGLEEAIEFGVLADDSYINTPSKSYKVPGTAWTRLGEEDLQDLGVGDLTGPDGANAAVYRQGSRIVVGFRGTEPGVDFVQDAANGAGLSAIQYHWANNLMDRFRQAGVRVEATIGHSLGGGLARHAGGSDGIPFVIFNPAEPAATAHYPFLRNDHLGQSYVLQGEALSGANYLTAFFGRTAMMPWGHTTYVPTPLGEDWNTFQRHSMVNLVYALRVANGPVLAPDPGPRLVPAK